MAGPALLDRVVDALFAEALAEPLALALDRLVDLLVPQALPVAVPDAASLGPLLAGPPPAIPCCRGRSPPRSALRMVFRAARHRNRPVSRPTRKGVEP